jgi:hypothetical protein
MPLKKRGTTNIHSGLFNAGDSVYFTETNLRTRNIKTPKPERYFDGTKAKNHNEASLTSGAELERKGRRGRKMP